MVLEQIGGNGITQTGGRFVLCKCERFSDLENLQADSPYFALFTAFDLSQTAQVDLSRIAAVLVERGLAYACCWGKDCEKLHDAIDRVDIDRIGARDGDYRNVIMTTWHNAEPLRKALCFFEYAAEPAETYLSGCLDYVVATLPEYEDEVRKSIALVDSR